MTPAPPREFSCPEKPRWDSPARLKEVIADVELLALWLARRRFEGAHVPGGDDVPRVLWVDELSTSQKEELGWLLLEEADRERRAEWRIRDEYREAS